MTCDQLPTQPPTDSGGHRADSPTPVRQGAPKENTNGLRHGLYSSRSEQFVSVHAKRQCHLFRRAIEEAVIKANDGEPPTLYQAALIQSATELARLAIANREVAADKLTTLTLEQRLAVDAAYAKLLETRDRKLRELGLDVRDAPKPLPSFELFSPPNPEANHADE